MSRSLAAFDPWRAASHQRVVAGRLSLGDLPRLLPLLVAANGEVAYRLEFAMVGRKVEVRLRLAAELPLRCQRCMDAYIFPVRVDSQLRLVSGPIEAERLGPEFEPLLLEEGALLDPRHLIEDELLLALPQVPRHAEGACLPAQTEAGRDRDGPPERENPFAVLANYKI